MESQLNALLFTKAFYKDYGLLKEIATGFLIYTENPYDDPPEIVKTVSRNTIRASLLWHSMAALEGIWEDLKNSRLPTLFSHQVTDCASRTLGFNRKYPITNKPLPIDVINMLGALYVGIGFLDQGNDKLIRSYMLIPKCRKAYDDDKIFRDFGINRTPTFDKAVENLSPEEFKSLPEPSNLFQPESETQRVKGDLAIIDFKKIVTPSPTEVLAPIDWDHKAIDNLLQNLLQP